MVSLNSKEKSVKKSGGLKIVVWGLLFYVIYEIYSRTSYISKIDDVINWTPPRLKNTINIDDDEKQQ
jgi:superoxide dismutase